MEHAVIWNFMKKSPIYNFVKNQGKKTEYIACYFGVSTKGKIIYIFMLKTLERCTRNKSFIDMGQMTEIGGRHFIAHLFTSLFSLRFDI